MKRIMVLDEFAICFCCAVAYGIGFFIPEKLGFHVIISLIICCIPGLLVKKGVEKIIFSKYIQENFFRRILSRIACVIVYLIGSFVSILLFRNTLTEDLHEEFLWAVGLFIVPLVFSWITFVIKKWRLNVKYGDGSTGYYYTEAEKAYMYGLREKNEEITGEYNESIAVKTETGTFVGVKKRGVISYLGIPYAKPPVGKLRWKKTVSLSPSNKVFEAKYYGPSAVQPEDKANCINYHIQSEDCLYLNIWKAKETKEQELKYPVLVYLHNGNFVTGGSANPMGDGRNFVKKNPETIFVSINYRLGLFGFMNFSQVEGEEDFPDALNCGLFDQIEALKWIKRNIAAFGGDPENITLMGVESGAVSAVILSMIDASRDLFRKIICVSPSNEYLYNSSLSALESGRALTEEFGVKSIKELMDISTENLKKVMTKPVYCSCVPSSNTELIPGTFFEKLVKDDICRDLEMILVIPENEISNMIVSHAKEKVKKSAYESGCENTDKSMLYGHVLSENGHKVRILIWNIKPNAKKFKSNAISFVTTVLQNFDAGEVSGYINDKRLAKIFQKLFVKYISDDEVELYRNEIVGMDVLDWPLYTKEMKAVLHVRQKDMEIEYDFRMAE